MVRRSKLIACVIGILAVAASGCGTSIGTGSVNIVPTLRAPRTEVAGAKCVVMRSVDVSRVQLDGKPVPPDHPLVVEYSKAFSQRFAVASRIPVVAPEKAAECGAIKVVLEVWDLRSGKEDSANAKRRYDQMLEAGRPANNASLPPSLQFQTSMAQTQLASLSLALARSNYDSDTVLRVTSADDRPLVDIVLNTEVSIGALGEPAVAFAAAGSDAANTYALTMQSLVAP